LVPKDYFDEPVAAHYDDPSSEMFAPALIDRTIDLLAELADGGAVLELGIGTGRVALPLSARGVRVSGIDLSSAMVARLREKPGADGISVTIGDFAETQVDGTFSLAYLVFNTISNLTTQDAQVACFRNAARHLEMGGRFLIEVGIPSLQRLPAGETVRPFHVSPTRLGFDEYDIAHQGLISHHYTVTDDHLQFMSIPFRYTWPAELDLMARLAGMRLENRWSDWDRSPYTSESRKHLSVWRRVADGAF
jgi:SAM-dependent methyltransferase